MTTRANVLDMSKWVGSILDVDGLIYTFEPDIVILRCSIGVTKDSKFEEHYSKLNGKVPIGVYTVFNPYYTPSAQVNVFKNSIAGKDIVLATMDLEIHGGFSVNYLRTKFNEYRQLVTNLPQVQSMYDKPWIYSAKWFIDGFFGGSPEYFGDYRIWNANYPFGREVTIQDKDNVISGNLHPYYNFWSTYDLWQWSDKLKSYNVVESKSLDVNVSFLQKDDFLHDVLGEPFPPPQGEDMIGILRPMVSTLNIRDNPTVSSDIAGKLYSTREYYFYDLLDLPNGERWARVGLTTWVAIVYGGQTLAQITML